MAATTARSSRDPSVVVKGFSAAAKRANSSVQRCSPTRVIQKVLRSEGTLIRVHSVSRKVFRPKLAMYCRLALTFWGAISIRQFEQLLQG